MRTSKKAFISIYHWRNKPSSIPRNEWLSRLLDYQIFLSSLVMVMDQSLFENRGCLLEPIKMALFITYSVTAFFYKMYFLLLSSIYLRFALLIILICIPRNLFPMWWHALFQMTSLSGVSYLDVFVCLRMNTPCIIFSAQSYSLNSSCCDRSQNLQITLKIFYACWDVHYILYFVDCYFIYGLLRTVFYFGHDQLSCGLNGCSLSVILHILLYKILHSLHWCDFFTLYLGVTLKKYIW